MAAFIMNKIERIVRDHIPLEQGLRLVTDYKCMCGALVRDHIPLEQGLRQNQWKRYKNGRNVRDHIPLEQGLRRLIHRLVLYRNACQRPYSIRTRIKTCKILHHKGYSPVRDHIPLEQGLRRTAWAAATAAAGQRPYSIRTRIKTITVSHLRDKARSQRPYSIRTRIKTNLKLLRLRILAPSETIFH